MLPKGVASILLKGVFWVMVVVRGLGQLLSNSQQQELIYVSFICNLYP